MIVFRISSWCKVAALLALGVPLGLNSAMAQERGPPAASTGLEILTRGPVHEAFAETVTFDPEPGFVAPKAPPAAIEEVPPDQRPEGTNVAWISGYWAWDDERTDFLWVSGIWRSLPPGRQWMPGYWGKSTRGSQWTSGYWADANLSEVEYLPEPPATVEAGPNAPAPSVDHRWLPGCWMWQQNRYAWRPGYWAGGQSDWDWVPAHYVWSPRGYVFVGGYYDYSVARRGVLFAPVYLNSSVYSRSGFSYSPVTVINPAVFASHLFLRPSYGHYYFGDYYASNYASSGYSPWFSYHSSRAGYDPFYAHQSWHYRNDRQWNSRVEAEFSNRRDHEEARPPRTWTAQQDRRAKGAANGDKTFVVGASIDELAKSKDSPIRFQPLAQEERQQIAERGVEVRTFREERQKLEAAAVLPSPGAPLGTVKPVKVKLPRTPITAQPVERLGKDAPPKAIEAPLPDIKIEPKPRKPRGNSEVPKGEPRVPKVDTKPELPKVKPAVAPKPAPSVEPKAPKVDPKPERPKAEPKEKPVREPATEPKSETDDRPKGGSKGPPKGNGKIKP